MYKAFIKMSLQALRDNFMRSVLTTLGIIIGTAIVIIVLSVGAGIKILILEQLSDISPETIGVEVMVPSEGTKMKKDMNTAQSVGEGVQIKTLKIKDVEDIRKLSNIDLASGMTLGQDKFTYKDNEKIIMLFAVESDYQKIDKVKLKAGRFFTDREDKSLEEVIVIGSEVKNKLFGNEDAIGKKVKIKNMSFEVIGVMEEIGTKFFMNMDEIAYIPVRTMQKKIMGEDYLHGMMLSMKNKYLVQGTITQIEKVIRKNHKIKDPDKDDFVVRTMDEAMDMINTVTAGISILLFCLAAISLIVGGVGIMNVMYVSVTERTNEIGLKKAIGAKPSAIKFQFLSESVIISFIGGIIGIGIGISFTWLVSYIATLLGFNWPFTFDIKTVLLAVSVSIIIGITFGYAPAKKAGTLNPIEALRSN